MNQGEKKSLFFFNLKEANLKIKKDSLGNIALVICFDFWDSSLPT